MQKTVFSYVKDISFTPFLFHKMGSKSSRNSQLSDSQGDKKSVLNLNIFN